MSYIECQSVTKKFGEKTALDNVSLSFSQGRISGLLGPNGSGKTTLIRIINRITIPTEGKILIDGKLLTQQDVAKIGYLPEERGLYRKMKVSEQLLFLAQLKGLSYSQAKTKLQQWFKHFNIESWWNKKLEELSKGMAQKLQFIATVIHEPKLIILDEPFSGFDPVNADIIRKEIIRLKDEGATIILSTHNMESVEELCDDVSLINMSKLILSGSLHNIRSEYGSNYMELVYKSDDHKDLNTDMFDIVSHKQEDDRHTLVLDLSKELTNNDLLRYMINNGLDIISFRNMLPKMNDIFIKLVKEDK